MFIVSMRSSSYGAYTGCEHSYFIQYVLNHKSPSGKKADLGNIVHKGAEFLALLKMYEQGDINVIEDDGIGIVDPKLITPEWAIDTSFAYYKEISPHNQFTNADLKQCQTWMKMLVGYENGLYDPRNRDIVTPEKKFEIEIKEPWAVYDYEIEGKRVRGNLILQGTVDLITRLDNKTYEVIDWKTGSCVDFFKNFKRKEYEDFCKDPQLLIYYYAIRQLFPEIETILFTIMWVRDGGPFTMCFTDEDYIIAENLIKKRFLDIKNNTRPNLNIGQHCHKFCWFGKNKYKDTGKSYCEFFANQVKRNGVDKTAEFYGDMSKLGSYGDGGGRKANAEKEL